MKFADRHSNKKFLVRISVCKPTMKFANRHSNQKFVPSKINPNHKSIQFDPTHVKHYSH